MGCSLWGHRGSDRTEHAHTRSHSISVPVLQASTRMHAAQRVMDSEWIHSPRGASRSNAHFKSPHCEHLCPQ